MELGNDAKISQAVRHGRINTPQGIFYLSPAPTYDEIEQMRKDNEWLSNNLNRRKKK
jgi:hypothetical protein